MTVRELRDRLTAEMNRMGGDFGDRRVRLYDADSNKMETITGFETGANVFDLCSDTQGS